MGERPIKRRRISADAPEDFGDSDSAAADAAINGASTPSSFNGFTTESADEMDEDEANSEDDARTNGHVRVTEPHVVVPPPHKSSNHGVQSKPSSDSPGPVVGAGAFKMQCVEMLRSTRPHYESKEALIAPILKSLDSCLSHVSSHEPMAVDEAEKKLLKSHKISVPFPEPRPSRHVKYQLAFSKPIRITKVGSFPNRTALKVEESLSVDLAVEMPHTLFTEKDYLNYRYLHKRAYYLARLAAAIQDLGEDQYRISFDLHQGDRLLPILLIQPSKAGADSPLARAKCDIRVIPFVDHGVFPTSKLAPHKNCVRPRASAESLDEVDLPPTPYYNASILLNTNTMSFEDLVNIASKSSPGYLDACILGRIWLRQRGLSDHVNRGGFGPFEWCALLALLLKGGGSVGQPALLSTYDGEQLFKATLKWLAVKDLCKSPAIIGGSSHLQIGSNDAPILFDGERGLNLLARTSAWSYDLLRIEAHATVTTLSKNLDDQFDSTFIVKVDEPALKFDYLVHIPMTGLKIEAQTDLLSTAQPPTVQQLHQILRKGLGDRATHISITLPCATPWAVNLKSVGRRSKDTLTISIMIEPGVALRAVDKGPPAGEEDEAIAFRNLWGSKAELRRFKDGSIMESAVWYSDQAGPLLQEIISHLIRTHFGDGPADGLEFIGNDFTNVIGNFNPKTTVFEPVRNAYESIAREIRGLQDLPLQIRQIRPSSSAISYSSIDEPLGSGWNSQEPIDIIVQFEGSARWPDDLPAIQMTKIAFLLKLDELLQQSDTTLSSRVGLENENADILNHAFLDVSHASGATFRIRIHHDREQTLIERRLADKALPPNEREAAGVALAAYKRTFERRPAHAQAIELLATRHPALSPTLRVVKRWFAAHMLSPHFAPELIETLAARQFLHPAPWPTAPATPQTGLLRTLLFLSRWDWSRTPAIVHFGGAPHSPEHDAAETRFRAWREVDPAMNRVALFIATNLDTDGHTWTEFAPAKAVAGRMTALAAAAIGVVRAQAAAVDLSKLFAPSLKDYDFVIRLHAKFTRAGLKAARTRTGGASKFKNLQQQKAGARDDVSREHPVDGFLRELRALYSEAALFLYDADGGGVIAGVWSPDTATRRWKVNLTHSTLPVASSSAGGGGDAEAVANKDAMLAEMARLGGDMVVSVQKKR